MIYYNTEFQNHQSKIPYARGLAFKLDELPFEAIHYDLLKLLGNKHIIICNGEPMITNLGLLKLFDKIPKLKIAICGIKNSGKNDVANLLQSRHENFKILSFNSELKRITRDIFKYATDDERYDELRYDLYQFIASKDNELILNNVMNEYKTYLNATKNDIIICGVKTQRQFEFVKQEQFKIIYVDAPDETPQDSFDDFVVHHIREKANYVFKCDNTLSDGEQIAAKNRLIEYVFKGITFDNLLK